MAISTPPAGTALGSSTYPHRLYHSGLTEVRYAHPSGSNSNDGLTWGTAKADVVSAYDALPSNGGTIYIADSTYWDSVNTDRGLWLLDSNDPGYNGGSPTGGWRVRKRCSFIGVGTMNTANSHQGPQAMVLGGSTTDRTKPAIWLAGAGGPLYFENIHNQYHAVGWRMGITSDMSEVLDSSNVTMRNCSTGLNTAVSSGPGVELGYMYWLFMYDCTLNGAYFSYTLTAATRSGAVATFTTSVTHFLEVGDTVYVTGVTPSGYNGIWTVTSVTSTTFVVTLTADPGGSGSAFGTAEPVKNYRRAVIANESGRFAGGSIIDSGIIFIENCNFNGGGFYYKPTGAFGWGQVVMRNITHEGDFSGPEPPTFLLRTNPYGVERVANSGDRMFMQNIELADASTSTAIEVEGYNTPSDFVTVINASSTGNVTKLGGTAQRTQTGFSGGEVLGFHSGHKRAFGPSAVRYVNLASQTLSGGSWTSGVTAPDGTTSAGSLTGSGSTATGVVYQAGTTMNVGDWVIAGVWRRRSTVGTDSDENWPIALHTNASLKFDSGSTNYFVLDRPNKWGHNLETSDTSWAWLCWAAKVTTAGGAGDLSLQLRAGDGNTVAYYAPILFVVPAAEGWTIHEIRELVRHLQTYPATAAVGDVATLAGQNLHVAGNIELDGALNHDGTTVGLYGVTPATRPTAYTQTYSTADKTHAAPTAATLTVADGTGTNDNTIGAITADASVIAAVQEIADEINKLVADVADVKQLANSVIDDLQTLGILQ